jgi:hypothetical protein
MMDGTARQVRLMIKILIDTLFIDYLKFLKAERKSNPPFTLLIF